MTPTTITRWYQFRLKTLLFLVTAVSILLGLRIAYLRRQADFHVREADRYEQKAQSFDESYLVWDGQDWQKYSHHQRLAAEYRAAVTRPWILIDENMSTDDVDLDPWADLQVKTRKLAAETP